MANLWKQLRSKYSFACSTTRDGKRQKVSAKTTDRRQAMKIAEHFCLSGIFADELRKRGLTYCKGDVLAGILNPLQTSDPRPLRE